MSFFANLFKPKPANAPPAASVPVPPQLPKIAAPAAAPVCQEYKPAPPAQALLTPQQTPAQYLQMLQNNQMTEESVKFLAYGLPERESVWWAAQCARQVSSPVNLADQAALKAADAWVKTPSDPNTQAAEEAAANTDFQTPGAWAAQAAAWSKPPAPGTTIPPDPAEPAPPRLTPHAVVGAILLAVAVQNKKIPAVPKAPAQPDPPNPNPDVSQLAPPGLAPPGAVAPPAAGTVGAAGAGVSPLAVAGGGLAIIGAATLATAKSGPTKAVGAAELGVGLAGVAAPAIAAAVPAAGAPPSAINAAPAAPANPASGLISSAAGVAPGAAPVPTPGLNAPPPDAQALVKKEVSAQEKAEMDRAAAPFIKLGIDIASGTVRLDPP